MARILDTILPDSVHNEGLLFVPQILEDLMRGKLDAEFPPKLDEGDDPASVRAFVFDRAKRLWASFIESSAQTNVNAVTRKFVVNLLDNALGWDFDKTAAVSEKRSAFLMRLVRPILEMTRKQIEGYALAHGVRYRTDSTNLSSEYKRNMLRNEVFPVFERINPSVVRTLNREMGYFSEADEIVADYCAREIEGLAVTTPDGGVRIEYAGLLGKKHWRYLLYHILEPYGFNSATLASLEDLLSSDRTISGKRFESKDYVVLTEREGFRVVRRIAGQAGNDVRPVIPCLTGNPFMPVRGAGTYHVNDIRIMVEQIPWNADMPVKQPEGVILFDAEKLKFPFVLRPWHSGDWLVPFGMRGKKKVSDMFTDLKYDAFMKASAVMVVDVNSEGMADVRHIAGVAGVRIDDRYKVTPTTSSVIRVTIL